jgi:hypothetical protein
VIKFIYLLFLAIVFLEWNLGVIPRVAKWIPDLMCAMTAVIVVAHIAAKKPFAMQGKYFILFLFLFLLIIVGIAVNQVQPQVIFNGIRKSLRFLPIFLLPAVYAFTNQEIKQQLKLLFVLVLIQVPLAFYQRFVTYAGLGMGDMITGTVGQEKTLAGFTLWSLAIVFAFYLRNKISLMLFIVIGVLLLIPSALNESAGSFLLLPFVFIVPILFAEFGQNRFKLFFISAIFGSLLLSLMAVGYNSLYSDRWGPSGGIIEGIISGHALEYETQDETASNRIGNKDVVAIGRLTAISRALELLWEYDPVKLFVGVGIGNASDSFKDEFKGEYFTEHVADGISRHSLSYVMWHYGLIGVMISLLFCFMIFKDAKVLSSRDDVCGYVSLGFLAIVGMFLLQAIYVTLVLDNLLGILFAYFSGYIASQRVWLRQLR